MIIREEDYIAHIGTPRHSGRYPWGSGNTPSPQRNPTFLDDVAKMRSRGMTDAQIYNAMGINSAQFRAKVSIASNEKKQENIDRMTRLQDKGLSPSAIGREMGVNESTVRSWIRLRDKGSVDVLQTTANMLKDNLKEHGGYIDVGEAVGLHIGVSDTRLKTATAMLQEQGYPLYHPKVPQQFGLGKTRMRVLGLPGSPFPKLHQIRQIMSFTPDQGRTYLGIVPPLSISSKRIKVRWAEEGGGHADGVLFVRPGVKDLSMGGSRYAQVRVAVDGTHYLKGMAMYKDDLPKGVDIEFNTNKSRSSNKYDAMKPLKDDPDNPFGSQLKRQIIVKDKNGVEHTTSAMNMVYEQGAWGNWSKSLSSQMLSKQHPELAKAQLAVTQERARTDLDEIKRLTNPVIRRKLLQSYADEIDKTTVHLDAAALPKQATHAILPISSMKPHEVYAPNYKNGDRVVLVRYPHGGPFEIPQLRVNNRNAEAKKLIGTGIHADAIGIHHSVAQRLSGADFDGDTVIVIPNNRGLVTHKPPLPGLKDFDPIRAYPPYDGMRTIDGGTWHAASKSVVYPKDSEGNPRILKNAKGQHMGKVTNLIADMTIHGATDEDLTRALRHSMVVIDSEKHSLNYKASERHENIAQLKTKYQGGPRRGASTLITKANSELRVPHRKPRSAAKGGPIDRRTGEKAWEPTGYTYTDRKTGKVVKSLTKTRRLAEERDAFKLSSGTIMEDIYASHANKLKAMANEARKELVVTKPRRLSKSAEKTYAPEVQKLLADLNRAEKNKPLERQAQILAHIEVSQRRRANPNLSNDEVKKIKTQALAEARRRTGIDKYKIKPTPREWEAIQAGALSTNRLNKIINASDLDIIKKYATPKIIVKMTATKKARAQTMLATGYTQREVADFLGVSLSTLKASISE